LSATPPTASADGWGIATIWANGDHITQATDQAHDSYHDVAPYNTAPWRALVACQEIGHDFGLAHQNEQFTAPTLGQLHGLYE
jgi:hypothetical protein